MMPITRKTGIAILKLPNLNFNGPSVVCSDIRGQKSAKSGVRYQTPRRKLSLTAIAKMHKTCGQPRIMIFTAKSAVWRPLFTTSSSSQKGSNSGLRHKNHPNAFEIRNLRLVVWSTVTWFKPENHPTLFFRIRMYRFNWRKFSRVHHHKSKRLESKVWSFQILNCNCSLCFERQKV